jgi:hypothetical protein
METNISLNIKKRFVKDYNLPIKLFDDEMFKYYIGLYNEVHKTKYKYHMLELSVMGNKGEEGFMKEFNSVKDKIIADISSKESYKRLADSRVPIEYTSTHQISTQNIYTPEFDNCVMYSIDLKKANFNSMKYYDPDLVNGKKDYVDFISEYTDDPYMKESKQLRQVIFGNLLPKKQQSIQKAIINMIADRILSKIPTKVTSMGTDELIIHGITEKTRVFDILFNLIGAIPTDLIHLVKIEHFRLLHVHHTKPFYVKVTENNIEFKNVPTIYYPQVYKHYMDLPIGPKDLLFEYEGEMATFVNPLYH